MTKYNDKTKDALRPGSGKVHCRGLSRKDYAVATRMIKKGIVTEAELIKAGKILPKGLQGPKTSEAYKWFMEAKI